MRRLLASGLAWCLATSVWGSPPAPPTAEQEAAEGIRLAKQGDFEAAVVTLDSAVRRLEAEPGRQRLLVRALVQLGASLVALDQGEAARVRFQRALAIDPRLRLRPEEFAPRVIVIFEQARRAPQVPPVGDGIGGGQALVFVGLGGAAVAVALALAADDDDAPPATVATAGSARFAQPSVVCPDGSIAASIPFSVLLDVAAADLPFVIGQAEVAMTIVSSPDAPAEVGIMSNRPAAPTPEGVVANNVATVRIDSTLLCSNALGGPGRFHEWSGRVTLRGLSGLVLTAATFPPPLRVNLP